MSNVTHNTVKFADKDIAKEFFDILVASNAAYYEDMCDSDDTTEVTFDSTGVYCEERIDRILEEFCARYPEKHIYIRMLTGDGGGYRLLELINENGVIMVEGDTVECFDDALD